MQVGHITGIYEAEARHIQYPVTWGEVLDKKPPKHYDYCLEKLP